MDAPQGARGHQGEKMDLTEENKKIIDEKDIEDLLRGIRFSPVGNPWFQGETGKYWLKRYAELRLQDPAAHIAASKCIGWEGK
jgi:hypothetical protein